MVWAVEKYSQTTAMELLMINGYTLQLAAAVFICFFGVTVFHSIVKDEESQEPPLVAQKIPYFGHVIGLLRYGLGYFDVIRFENLSSQDISATHISQCKPETLHIHSFFTGTENLRRDFPRAC